MGRKSYSSHSSCDTKKSEKTEDELLTYKQVNCELRKIQKRLSCDKPKYLYNSDFATGTYIIDKPGLYVLQENIIFNPNPDNDYMPHPNDPRYQSHAFSLGFFAAIVIKTKYFYLDLNGYTISQSPKHALQQRFFALIELADSPFIPKQGPGNFGSTIKAAQKGIIANGYLGLTSHHGIHGNFPKWILFEKLDITDFEVAGIALNGSDSVIIENVNIHDSRKNVPVLATYSASRFTRFFAKDVLVRYSNQLSPSQTADLNAKLLALEVELDTACAQILSTGETTVPLFRNESQLPDGNIYGVLFHPPGVAIDDFITEKEIDWSKNIFLHRTKVINVKDNVPEVIGLSLQDGSKVQVDAAGALLQIEKITDVNGFYAGNALSDLQILLAEIGISLGVKIGTTNITQDVIDWANSGSTPIQDLLNLGYKYKCNGDSMFHVNKGAVGYRFDGVENLSMYKCMVKNLSNVGWMGNELLCGAYSISHDQQKRPGYCGDDTVGINISYCKSVRLHKNQVREVLSANGNAGAVHIMNESKCICLDDIYIRDVTGGTMVGNAWIGTSYYGDPVPYVAGLPNEVPVAVGIFVAEDSKADINKRSIKRLHAAGAEVPIWTH